MEYNVTLTVARTAAASNRLRKDSMMAVTVTQSTGYTIDLGRYFKVAFALLGVHILAPTFFWDVF